MRIEDLDPGRCRPEYVAAITEDLDWLGLSPDGAVIVQSQRSEFYGAALHRLRQRGLLYACFCTRADIAQYLAAPHGKPHHYPGTCRRLPDDPQRRAEQAHCWRLDSARALAEAGLPGWTEEGAGPMRSEADDLDDVILARKDAPASYHLACVIDDWDSGVSLVVRGNDLRASTPVQRLLQLLLGLPEPAYLHHPLVLTAEGRRLAKRDQAPTLRAMRKSGVDGRQLAAQLLDRQLPLGFRWSTA